jgi:dTDP-glucose 4,6-dehydratase
MNNRNILVTGGAGFIGGNFVHYMVEKYPNYNIFNLDSLTYAGDLTKHKRIADNDNYNFENIDITDIISLEALFNKIKFEFVIHFAAESHVDRSITEPDIFTKTNILGTQNLLEVSKKYGVKKFLHVSTDEVYGELDFNPDTFFTENTPINPSSPYSASKASSDLLVKAYSETYNLPVNITRCSNNYGPYHFPEKLIPLVISRAIENKKIPVYGAGNNIRDWLYVEDHCSAIDLVLHQGKLGEVYNIGGHNERTNLEVVKTILELLGKDECLIEHVDDRLGHDKRYAIDPSKIEELGWRPKYGFEEGIKHTIDWYLNNEEWLKSILTGDYMKYFEKQYSL